MNESEAWAVIKDSCLDYGEHMKKMNMELGRKLHAYIKLLDLEDQQKIQKLWDNVNKAIYDMQMIW